MYQLFEWFKKITVRSEPNWTHSFSAAKLNVLKQSIKDAFHFLRTTHVKSFFYRHKLPWYLLLGAENSGKTSLLAMSGLNLVSTDNQPLQYVNPTPHCHWFFGKEAVFLDVSGGLMVSDITEDDSLHLWKKFVSLLYRYRHFRPMDGLIVCIDLLDFQAKNFEQRRLHVDILRHHIQTFKHTLPVHLMFTRCDRIPGFTGFFQMLSAEERQQACGISLPRIDQQNFTQQVETQFNAFLQRINQQVIVRLQRERDPEKRVHIKNFPLQLEAQKHIIVQLASQLHSTKNSIQSLYFTSSQQRGIQNDALATLMNSLNFPGLPNTPEYLFEKNAYFIQNALKRIVQTKHQLPRKIPLLAMWNSRWFYPTLLTVLLLAIMLILPGYIANKRAITHVETLISQYQNTAITSENPLPLLNTLRQSLDDLTHATNPLTGLIFHRASQLKDQLNTLYQQALIAQFMPWLQQALTAQLQHDVENKTSGLFDTLKVYLMLGDARHLDKNSLNTWLNQYAQTTFSDNKETQQFFVLHVNALLANPLFQSQIDTSLVGLARDALNSLPPTELAYLMLQEKYPPSSTQKSDATTHPDVPRLVRGIQIEQAPKLDPADKPRDVEAREQLPSNAINPLYSAIHFSTIVNQAIPAAVTRMTKKDAWVLDTESPNALADSLNKQLIADTQQLYKDRYLNYWQTQLTNITVPAFKDLKQARAFTTALGTNRSLLLQPLNTIQDNLKPLTQDPASRHIITALEETRQSLTNAKTNDAATKALANFKTYLDSILSTSDAEKATLMAAQDRMRNNGKDAITQLLTAAKTAPAPLNQWLNKLAVNTWNTMLQTSGEQLNTLWSKNVFTKYNDAILNRYPVFKNATSDIRLADFTRFFGPDGVMDGFFKQNLAPFVDTSTLYWRWKTVNGAHLNIPQSSLEMFNRAYVIRKMYFGDHQKTPQLKFTLSPTNAALISDNFILSINGQTVDYSVDFRQVKNFVWSGVKPSVVSLQQNQGAATQVLFKESGDWALFKLFARAEMATSYNPQLYQFEFNVGDKQVIYELVTDSPFNPFIPDMITRFRCPEML